MTISLTREDIHSGNLILINKSYPITKDNKVKLVPFSEKYDNIKLDTEVNLNLHKILKHIKAKNLIVPVDGYRTSAYQKELYLTSIKENGLEFTKKYVAYPDTSEHQTGLAIDLGKNTKEIDYIRPSFPNTGICKKFRTNASQFGFIERYLEAKIPLTNIAYEEWHFRYIGYPHSQIISDLNMCLEEYIVYLKQFKYPSHPLKYKNYEIYYLELEEDNITIEIDNNTNISGNNIDGFIITKENKDE